MANQSSLLEGSALEEGSGIAHCLFMRILLFLLAFEFSIVFLLLSRGWPMKVSFHVDIFCHRSLYIRIVTLFRQNQSERR